MDDLIEIVPVDRPLNAIIRPPGSKSITNRALVCAAVATGRSTLAGALASDDTRVMIESLERLGIPVNEADDSLAVEGCGGVIPNGSAELFIGNSGTSVRFLTAVLSIAGGNYRIDGVPRMRERPIEDLIRGLSQLGVDVRCEHSNGCPPVIIDSRRSAGGTAVVKGNVSSQYLSGMLMASPLAESEIQISVDGPLISQPYIDMTCKVMSAFGVRVERAGQKFVVPAGQTYQAIDFDIEPDASAASYFWAAAAICGGTVTVQGLNAQSLQGDVGFVDALERMGCQVQKSADQIRVTGPATQSIEIDMGDISDTVQTLAAVAMHVPGRTTVTGVAHNRVKETDRIGNLAIELRKLGGHVREYDDGLSIESGTWQPAEIETYDDHRMAMSLALCGLRNPGVKIRDPGCVSKTYPHFFDDLQSVVRGN